MCSTLSRVGAPSGEQGGELPLSPCGASCGGAASQGTVACWTGVFQVQAGPRAGTGVRASGGSGGLRCRACPEQLSDVPGSTGSSGQGAPHLPSLPPSVSQAFSFFPKSLFLLLVLYLSYLFRILKIPNLNDTWLG